MGTTIRNLETFGDQTAELTGYRREFHLLMVSILGLFLEICLIRWHGTEFRAAAYFKNITLLASFLGLGLGFILAARDLRAGNDGNSEAPRAYFILTPLLIAVHVVGFGVLSRLNIDAVIRHPQTGSGLWLWSVDTVEAGTAALIQLAIFYGFFLSLFVATIVVFIPIGQHTGHLMRQIPPVRAYSINILGGIVGVAVFTIVSYLWLPPAVWFGIALLLVFPLLRRNRFGLSLTTVSTIVLLTWLAVDWPSIVQPDRATMQHVYSPYQHLEFQPYYAIEQNGHRTYRGVRAFANKSYHLNAADHSNAWHAQHGRRHPWAIERALGYDLPYLMHRTARNVLVVGAGAGNDVAAALRNGPSDIHVDAVEIDPAIRAFGRRHHPEQPYSDSRVTVHIGDARHFMKRTRRKYDLIVFGLLDSHTLLSGMSNLRLDNYVYTKESFQEAKSLLSPGGVVALSFCTEPNEPVTLRLYNMLREVFSGEPLRAYHIGADGGTILIAGRALDASIDLPPRVVEAEVTSDFEAIDANTFPPDATDDWPFLYMTKREIPSSYLWLVGLLAGTSIVWVKGISRGGGSMSGRFFFLGAGFLLLETKGITELALVWGSTWMVNSGVFIVILSFILLANLYVTMMRPVRIWPYYAGLMISLGAGYVLNISALLDYGWWTAAVMSATLLLVPIFFAGVIFAVSLKRCASVPAAFASNLIGAILGGLCEYAAMAFGFRALYLLAIGLYVVSAACRVRGSSSSE